MKTVPCSSCGKPMVWVQTENGKGMPIDPDPVPNGNLHVEDGTAYVIKKGSLFADTQPKYVSHFSSCPNAVQHRKAT